MTRPIARSALIAVLLNFAGPANWPERPEEGKTLRHVVGPDGLLERPWQPDGVSMHASGICGPGRYIRLGELEAPEGLPRSVMSHRRRYRKARWRNSKQLVISAHTTAGIFGQALRVNFPRSTASTNALAT